MEFIVIITNFKFYFVSRGKSQHTYPKMFYYYFKLLKDLVKKTTV